MLHFGCRREMPFACLAYVHIVMMRVTWFGLGARTVLNQTRQYLHHPNLSMKSSLSEEGAGGHSQQGLS